MIHQVGPDLGMTARAARQQDLGANPVGARHQHRLTVSGGVQRKEPAERADPGKHLRALGGRRQGADELNGPIAGVDVNARVAVGRHRATVSSASLSISSWTGTGTG